MAQTIQIRRGLKTNLAKATLAPGEPAYCTDTNELYIGTTQAGVTFKLTVQDLLGTMTGLKTTAKDTFVNAINELKTISDGKASASELGSVVSLQTVSKTSLVSAINELVNKTYSLSTLTDVDTTGKTNGYVLQYDATSGKFKPAPLPTGTGSGATNLDGLSDVDVTTKTPVEGDVLEFSGGIWKPVASSAGFILEDWIEETTELVSYIDITPPKDVTSLSISNMRQTSFTIWWTESISPDTQDYVVFIGNTQLGIVPATQQKVNPLSFKIIGLTSATNYTVTIKTRDASLNVSSGASINIRTYGTSALNFSGTSATWEHIVTPSLTWDTAEMTYYMAAAQPSKGVIDFRPGTQNVLGFDSFSNLSVYGNFNHIWIDGVQAPSYAPQYFVGKLMTVNAQPVTGSTGVITFGADYISAFGNSNIAAEIYEIKVWNQGNLIARYNFTEQFAGTSIPDTSGNNHNGTLTGGSWITSTRS